MTPSGTGMNWTLDWIDCVSGEHYPHIALLLFQKFQKSLGSREPANPTRSTSGDASLTGGAHSTPPPPLCACTALSKHEVGVEPPF